MITGIQRCIIHMPGAVKCHESAAWRQAGVKPSFLHRKTPPGCVERSREVAVVAVRERSVAGWREAALLHTRSPHLELRLAPAA
eukprot:357762-Chlamydomonas_euryale.AAC.7